MDITSFQVGSIPLDTVQKLKFEALDLLYYFTDSLRLVTLMPDIFTFFVSLQWHTYSLLQSFFIFLDIIGSDENPGLWIKNFAIGPFTWNKISCNLHKT